MHNKLFLANELNVANVGFWALNLMESTQSCCTLDRIHNYRSFVMLSG